MIRASDAQVDRLTRRSPGSIAVVLPEQQARVRLHAARALDRALRQLEAGVQPLPRAIDREQPPRLLGGVEEELHRARPDLLASIGLDVSPGHGPLCRGVVVRQQLDDLEPPLAGGLLDPARRLQVRHGAVALRDALVGHVPDERVLEDVLRLPGHRRPSRASTRSRDSSPRSSSSTRAGAASRERPTGSGQKTRPTTAAACSARFSSGPRRSTRAASTAWTVSGISTAVRPGSARQPSGVARDPPLVDEMAEDLLDEERVAAGALDDARVQVRRQILDREQQADQAAGVLRLERIEEDRAEAAAAAAPAGPAVGQVGASRAEEQHAALDARAEIVEHVEEGRIGPVDVLDDRDQRALRREGREERAPRLHQLDAELLGVDAAEVVARAPRSRR